jgi:divalent metal cation (Fe/Co/Zn/Cd) transporter
MQQVRQFDLEEKEFRYYRIAFLLSLITIGYNIIEGLVSVGFGLQDETLALFGFGLDSFVEVISGIGVAHMVTRIRSNPKSSRDGFETTALKITGTSFYLLAVGLATSSLLSIYLGHKPETTIWGIIIGLISIVSMGALIHFKLKVGNALHSEAILADASCTKACLYLSVIILISSLIYELTGFGYIDSLGSLGIAYFAYKEGKESFDKAKGKACCSCGTTCSG